MGMRYSVNVETGENEVVVGFQWKSLVIGRVGMLNPYSAIGQRLNLCWISSEPRPKCRDLFFSWTLRQRRSNPRFKGEHLLPPRLFVRLSSSPLFFLTMSAAAPPRSTGSRKLDAVVQKTSAKTPEKLSGVALYSRFALAGAVCCSVTHGALTPVDV